MLASAIRAVATGVLPSSTVVWPAHRTTGCCQLVDYKARNPSIRWCAASATMSGEEDKPSLDHNSSSPLQVQGEGLKTVNARIKGTVQGVYYRKWTVETALKLGLQGWVRNCGDGSVEAVFSGQPKVVDTMLHKCHSGPPDARVTAVDVSPWTDPVPHGFHRKPTTWF